jgi:uncharacterized protein (TIGR02118 family)
MGSGYPVAQDVLSLGVEPRSMSRSIDHFSGDPTVVIRVVSNPIKAGLGLNPEAVAMAQHSSKICNMPKDPAHFRKYYVETLLPLARKLPGLKASRYSFDMKPLGPGKAPYFCIFEAEFENEAALMGALGSKEGKAVAGDVPNYASGGVTMMHFAVG